MTPIGIGPNITAMSVIRFRLVPSLKEQPPLLMPCQTFPLEPNPSPWWWFIRFRLPAFAALRPWRTGLTSGMIQMEICSMMVSFPPVQPLIGAAWIAPNRLAIPVPFPFLGEVKPAAAQPKGSPSTTNGLAHPAVERPWVKIPIVVSKAPAIRKRVAVPFLSRRAILPSLIFLEPTKSLGL